MSTVSTESLRWCDIGSIVIFAWQICERPTRQRSRSRRRRSRSSRARSCAAGSRAPSSTSAAGRSARATCLSSRATTRARSGSVSASPGAPERGRAAVAGLDCPGRASPRGRRARRHPPAARSGGELAGRRDARARGGERRVAAQVAADRAPAQVASVRRPSLAPRHRLHRPAGQWSFVTTSRYLDQALDLAAQTDDWPEPARFRWNVESLLPLERWLAVAARAAREELSERVASASVRGLRAPVQHAHRGALDRRAWPACCALPTSCARHGLPDRHRDADRRSRARPRACQARSPLPAFATSPSPTTTPARAAPHLTGGARAAASLLLGHARGRARTRLADRQPARRRVPGGEPARPCRLAGAGRRAAARVPGGARRHARIRTARECSGSRRCRRARASRRPYPHDLLHLRVQGSLADNAPPSLVPAEVVRAWNERWAYPRLTARHERGLLRGGGGAARRAARDSPGDWTNWWADGVGSAARVNGFNRRAQARVRTGQTLNVARRRARRRRARSGTDAADRAYESMGLFDEHTWGAAHPSGDAARRSRLRRAAVAVESVARRRTRSTLSARSSSAACAASRLDPHASPLPTRRCSSSTRLRWRTDVVRLFVPYAPLGDGAFALATRSTGASFRSAVEPGPPGANRPAGEAALVRRARRPAVGFRRYDARLGDGSSGRAAGGEPSARERALRLEFDLARAASRACSTGSSASTSSTPGSPFGFGQYVYDRYARLAHRDAAASRRRLSALPRSTALRRPRQSSSEPPALGRATVARADIDLRRGARHRPAGGPQGATSSRDARSASCAGCAGSTSIPLDKHASVGEGECLLHVPVRDSTSPERPFEVDGRRRPARQRLPGSAAHLHAVRTGRALRSDRIAVALGTLEAPLSGREHLLCPIRRSPTDRGRDAPGHLVAWAMNNVWDTNFALSQAGETRFAFAVGVREDDAARLGIATARPSARPLVGIVGGRDRRAVAVKGWFCDVDHPAVEVVMLAASRRGHDFAAFVHSLAADEVEVRVDFPALDVSASGSGRFLERRRARRYRRHGARLRPGRTTSRWRSTFAP